MKLTQLATVLALAVAFVPATAALADETQDRAAIDALMWRYVRALDTLDPDAYAAAFTADGSFGSGANAASGRGALREMVEGLRDGRDPSAPPMYHVITNAHVEFTGPDSARYHSYWMTVFGPAEAGGTPRVAAVGRGIDELRRVDGQWLIQSRNVAPQD